MSSFISKIACLLLFFFVLGNAFAQDEITYVVQMVKRNTDNDFNHDFKLEVEELGKLYESNINGEFFITVPAKFKSINISFINADTMYRSNINYYNNISKYQFYVKDGNLVGLCVLQPIGDTRLFVPTEIRKYIRNSNILRGTYPISYFNKAMGM